jgi:hypothetical protein
MPVHKIKSHIKEADGGMKKHILCLYDADCTSFQLRSIKSVISRQSLVNSSSISDGKARDEESVGDECYGFARML